MGGMGCASAGQKCEGKTFISGQGTRHPLETSAGHSFPAPGISVKLEDPPDPRAQAERAPGLLCGAHFEYNRGHYIFRIPPTD